ncbi:MAG: glycosyltransferase [Flavobacteriaceae bacterium]|nr:glycosyltransferase [Flavobacteriaceae bacterium]
MQEPIRVLQLFTILNRGGAETNVLNYYRKLDRTKFQFDFAVHRQEKGAYEDEIISLGGKIFRFSALGLNTIKTYQSEITQFFNNNSYLIIHGQCSELGYFFYKEAHRRGVPVIIAHGHNANPKWDLKSPFRWWLKKSMKPYVNAFFTCGDEASIWLFGKKNAAKAFTMTNAIAVDSFAYNQEKALEMRKKLKSEHTTNFIHVGRFNSQKNHEFLIAIFKELLQLDANQRLFLVGDGELKSNVQEQVASLGIEQQVVFLGLRDDVNQLLQGMDVFLFPSLFEGLPVSLVEAQASGIYSVISDGIPKEAILIPEHVTVISLKESATAWANKIHDLKQLQKIDVSSLIVAKGYDIANNVKTLEAKYTALLQKTK